jgi:hypothetical protein
MIHIYYHIYAIEGVEKIVDEQVNLIEKFIDSPYILNVGISIADDNSPTDKIIEKFYSYRKPNYRIRDIRSKGHELVTLDLIEKDIEKFGDTDYILYLHTKGASKQSDNRIENITSWRHLMNYYNIELWRDAITVFNNSTYNTYGVLFGKWGSWILYSGNFWWMTAKYAKTLNLEGIKKTSRYSAEHSFIQSGKDWKPYSPYNSNASDIYSQLFTRDEYAK